MSERDVKNVTEPIDKAGKWAGDRTGIKGLDDVVDLGLNYLTAGMVGFENGGLRTGGVLHALDEGLGEVTGRNMEREMMARAERRLLEEDDQRQRDMADERRRMERQDIQASRAAGRGQMSGQRGANTLTMGSGGLEGDFLGL